MFSVSYDASKKRLYVTLDGFLSDEEARLATDAIVARTNELDTGFDVVVDISTFKPVSPEGAEELKRGQAHLRGSGVGRVVTVVGTVLGRAQFSRKARETGTHALEVRSLDQAELILDGMPGIANR